MANDKQKNAEKAKYFISPIGHVRDRIIIHDSPNIPKEGQFMGLNGYHFLAKPGVEIDIPRPVRKMLDTRIRTETVYGQDGRAYTRDIPRVTYTLIKENVDTGDINIPAGEVIDSANPKSDAVDFPE